MNILKLCTGCDKHKEHIEFRPKNGLKANKDGLSPKCRECEREEKRKYDQCKRDEQPPRLCYVCGEYKHYSQFYSTNKSRDKNGHKCIECVDRLAIEKANKPDGRRKIEHRDGKKKCSICKLFKDYSQFWKHAHTTDGYYSSCIEDTIKSREPHKEENKKLQKEWVADNIEYVREYRNEYERERRKIDPVYRLRLNVKCAIRSAIKKYGNFSSYKQEGLIKAIFEHLPYSAEELKMHIESLWEPWMNWENHGRYNPNKKTWQIDHIIPQSRLPFSNLNDDNFHTLWALSNIQPLETIANIKKSNKLIKSNT